MFIGNQKIYLLLMGVFLVLANNSHNPIVTNNQYIQLNNPVQNVPNLLEFFSFYCPHCYQFEKICNVSNNIQKILPKDLILRKYHVNFLGNLGKQLTHAWAVAMALGIENQVSPILFTAIQKQHSIHTVNDIKKKIIQFGGVNESEYDKAWNSILVKTLIADQEQAAIKFQLKGVPAIFINGRYMIRNDKLDGSSVNSYIKQFSELLQLLINKHNPE